MITLFVVMPQQINLVWDECKPLLEKSFRDQIYTYDINDLYNKCVSFENQLWIIKEDKIIGTIVTTLSQGEKLKFLDILNMGGNRLIEWQKIAEQTLKQFAKENECKAIRAVMRKGLTKFLPKAIENGTIYIQKI